MLRGSRLTLKGFDKVTDEYERGFNDPEITQYMESARNYVFTKTSLQEWLDNTNKDPNMRYWGIYTEDKFIGTTNLKINWIHRHGDIGIMIFDKSEWGKGYATEVIGLVKDYAFNVLNLHRLYTGIYEVNIGSVKAFEKNGFKREGLLIEHRFCNGEYVNQIIMGCNVSI